MNVQCAVNNIFITHTRLSNFLSEFFHVYHCGLTLIYYNNHKRTSNIESSQKSSSACKGSLPDDCSSLLAWKCIKKIFAIK